MMSLDHVTAVQIVHVTHVKFHWSRRRVRFLIASWGSS